MINKINIGGVDYDIAGSASKNKEWKPFAINRCLKPTSVIGARYYFPNTINFSARFGDIRGLGNDEYFIVQQEGKGYTCYALRSRSNDDYIYNAIVTITDTPTNENLDWLKILPASEYSYGHMVDTDSPYLKILNGEVICVKPAIREQSTVYSKYSSRLGSNTRRYRRLQGNHKFYGRKLWRKGNKGNTLMYVTKCRQKYYSNNVLIVGNYNKYTDETRYNKYVNNSSYLKFVESVR